MDTVISSCCNAFIIVSGTTLVCSKCSKKVNEIEQGEQLVVAVHYNTRVDAEEDDDQSYKINKDIVENHAKKLKRMANDVTLELVSVPCPECNEPCTRLSRDLQGNRLFVCKNRHVFHA